MKNIILLLFVLLWMINFNFSFAQETVCTMDAMQCPDWTFVWRTWPNCEFNCSANYGSCTMDYNPVCAQPPMPTCPEWMMCAQVMPQPKTYSNKCLAELVKAEFLYEWECKDSNSSPWSAWEIETWWAEPISNMLESKICTSEYAPVCWEVQIQCIKSPCNPIKQTFSNSCEMSKNHLTKFLYNWECLSSKIETQVQTQLNNVLNKIDENKKESTIKKVISKIEVLLLKEDISDFKKWVLNFIKIVLTNY